MAFNPIAKKEYYSIGEVCAITGLKPHVLRYWETQFKGLQPVKNRAGNRAYRRREIEMVQLVKRLLYERKYTIDGARQRLEEMKRGSEEMEAERKDARLEDTFRNLADELGGLADYVDRFRRGEAGPGEMLEPED
ncbi:MAG TPA: MerR family transcriptional regulator [Gemmatimonadota bacterium]|nr:MerR family transcriptional regulator [Gemmatimonadota bacterium]